ncbi:MAG: hypothetical protein KC503_36200 [Myxococcales bacterium]|nr:hypothetical protein [Myxococcales bacterium]
MSPEQRRARAQQLIASIDWHNYDYTSAPGADMSFPDFGPNDPPRDVWVSKHYNRTSNMYVVHVIDLNDIQDGVTRRLYAQYGVPVDWTIDDKGELEQRIAQIDAAKQHSAEYFEQMLDYYGMVNEEHFEWMRERVTGKVGALSKRLAQEKLDRVREGVKQEYAERADQMRQSGELAPYMGVSLEAWAGAQAASVNGQPLGAILAQLGIDEPTWQAVSAEWNARMSRDTTATIANVYGQAFVGAGQGQFGASGAASAAAMNPGGRVSGSGAAEPVPFEKWIEITVAQEAGHQQGHDPAAVLAQFGITPADWGMIGAYWGQKFNENAMAMMDDYNRLTAQFQQKYGVGHADGMTSDEREEVVVQQLIDMARNGQANQIIGFLKQKFPDDADDNDALDWWVDKACDVCGEQGDRGAAQQLIPVRYQLSEQDEPYDEFYESAMSMLF